MRILSDSEQSSQLGGARKKRLRLLQQFHRGAEILVPDQVIGESDPVLFLAGSEPYRCPIGTCRLSEIAALLLDVADYGLRSRVVPGLGCMLQRVVQPVGLKLRHRSRYQQSDGSDGARESASEIS